MYTTLPTLTYASTGTLGKWKMETKNIASASKVWQLRVSMYVIMVNLGCIIFYIFFTKTLAIKNLQLSIVGNYFDVGLSRCPQSLMIDRHIDEQCPALTLHCVLRVARDDLGFFRMHLIKNLFWKRSKNSQLKKVP